MVQKRTDYVVASPKTIRDFYRIIRDILGAYREALKVIGKSNGLFRELDPDCKFLFFVGAGRSGTTLVSSMINAQKNALISHELDVFKYVRPFISGKIILRLIKKKDQEFSLSGRTWTNYSYNFETNFQGSYEKLFVIGDKKSGITSIRIKERPNLLTDLEKRIRIPFKIINHSRNPFDAIATMSNKQDFTISDAILHYFRRIESAMYIESITPKKNFLNTYHEDLVQNPDDEIEKIANFLGLPLDVEYIANCKKIIFDRIKTSRDTVQWKQTEINEIKKRIGSIGFLAHYRIDKI